MNVYNINLNIHYTSPQWVWEKLEKLYKEMPGWHGFVNGCPQWFWNDGKIIEASIEPSGLQFYGEMPHTDWLEWVAVFKAKASVLLGYEIGEVEDGFDFVYFAQVSENVNQR